MSSVSSQPLCVSESHFIQDYNHNIQTTEKLPPISTHSTDYIHSKLITSISSSKPSTPSSPPSASTHQQQLDDSGPDYYTSNSESESESESQTALADSILSEKQRAKRDRLKLQRDRIKPSYYYGEKELKREAIEKGINPPKTKRKGCRGVPVFEPSMEQFQDFYSYIEQIDRWGMRSGIVKIIPPKEWSDQLPNLGQESLRHDGQGQMLRKAKIKSPISQVIQGSRGLYRVMNVAKRRTYNALEWYDLANSAEHRPPDFSNKTLDQPSHLDPNHLDTPNNTRTTRSSRRSTCAIAPISQKAQNNRRRRVSKAHSTVDSSATALSSPLKQEAQERDHPNLSENLQSCQKPRADGPILPPHPDPNQHSSNQPEGAVALKNENLSDMKTEDIKNSPPREDLTGAPRPSTPEARTSDVITDQSHTMPITHHSTPSPQSPSVKNGGREENSKKKPGRAPPSAPTPEEWATFVERYDKLPYGASKSDYTFEICREIEQEYWRTIGNGGEPVYGADTMGSLFDDRTKDWNVANLDNLLNRLKLKKKIPGVNTPYLYFGSWRATFAWHVEDADLYSINYIHFGAPKFWYSIPQEHNQRFENFMSSSFAQERRTCTQFLRHKAFLASPAVLHSVGIQLNKVIHLPGEIIITYPYGYHSGFNLGYNCAESVNFANESWIEKGKKAQFCKCIDDAVTINVDAWLQEHAELCRKEEELRDRAAQKLKRQQQLEQRKQQKEEPPGGDAAPPKKKLKRENDATTHVHPEKLEGDIIKSSLTDPSLLNHQNPQAIASTNTPKPAKKPRPKKNPKSAADCPIPGKKEDNKSDQTLKRKPAAADTAVSGTSSSQRISTKRNKSSCASQKKKSFPCAFCPDPTEQGLLRIIEETPSAHVQDGAVQDSLNLAAENTLSMNETKCEVGLSPELSELAQLQPPSLPRPKPIKRAHKVCCTYNPRTWVERLPSGEEVIKGFEAIEKARWGLKCQLCSEKMGTKVQCTKSAKCANACHVTCGLNSGTFLLDMRLNKGDSSYSLLDPPFEAPPPGLDVGQDTELLVLCKQHNPHYQRAEAQRKARELADKVEKFNIGETLKVKTTKGIFQVVFYSRDENRKTLRVTFEDGHSDVLPYSRVYFGSADPKINGPKLNQPNQTNGHGARKGSNGMTNRMGPPMPTAPQALTLIDPSKPSENQIDPMIKMMEASTRLSHQNDQIPSSSVPNLNQRVDNNFFLQHNEQFGMNNNPNLDDRRLLLLADLSTVGHSNQLQFQTHPTHQPPNNLSANFPISSIHDGDHYHQNNANVDSNLTSNSFHNSLPNERPTISAIQKGLIDSRLL